LISSFQVYMNEAFKAALQSLHSDLLIQGGIFQCFGWWFNQMYNSVELRKESFITSFNTDVYTST